ncbi:hypothetical protein AKO1_010497, partial [Acrasis kona]
GIVVEQIAVTRSFIFALSGDGIIYFSQHSEPDAVVEIELDYRATQIEPYYEGVFLLCEFGKVYIAQMNKNNKYPLYQILVIENEDNVEKIVSSRSHYCGLITQKGFKVKSYNNAHPSRTRESFGRQFDFTPQENIVDATMRDDKTFVLLLADGMLVNKGYNHCGELCGEINFSCLHPFQQRKSDPYYLTSENIKTIHLHQLNFIFCTETGDTYTLGRDFLGYYSGEVIFDNVKPYPVTGIRDVKQFVSSGDRQNFHSVALTESGDVYVWGDNRYSQNGSNEQTHSFYPTLVRALYGKKATNIGAMENVIAALIAPQNNEIKHLFNNESLSDVCIRLEDCEQIIFCHKIILFARCPILLCLIENNMLNQYLCNFLTNSKHSFTGVDLYNGLLVMVYYLYSDELLSVKTAIFRNVDAGGICILRVFEMSLLIARFIHSLHYLLRERFDQDDNTDVIKEISKMLKNEPKYSRHVNETYTYTFTDFNTSLCKFISMCHSKLVDSHSTVLVDSTLKSDMAAIYNKKLYSDVIVQCACKQGEVRSVHCHKAILCGVCPFFKSMYSVDVDQNNKEVVFLEEFYFEIIDCLLRYMYYTDDSLIIPENMVEVLICADYFEVKSLKTILESKISDVLEIDSALDLFQSVINIHSTQYLRSKAVSFILQNFQEIYASDRYKSMDDDFKSEMEGRARRANIRFGEVNHTVVHNSGDITNNKTSGEMDSSFDDSSDFETQIQSAPTPTPISRDKKRKCLVQ